MRVLFQASHMLCQRETDVLVGEPMPSTKVLSQTVDWRRPGWRVMRLNYEPHYSTLGCAQATLADLLVRMACEHPHHALYQLFALRAGGRGRGGAAPGQAAAREALVHTVDLDKVAAAAAAIERVAADPRRCAPRKA